ncbi:hypothetical protein QU24_26830 [Pantoea rodasii]|uniref:Uncharacterized protein n=1 Tax=Pantoea rodasii TaxID=1076549 RepID=A0A0B1R009_9GAMM|nr:hypothetical protein QU24_26830 [Pantoea rodasii]
MTVHQDFSIHFITKLVLVWFHLIILMKNLQNKKITVLLLQLRLGLKQFTEPKESLIKMNYKLLLLEMWVITFGPIGANTYKAPVIGWGSTR